MENRKIRVAITHGDTNGIGYELIFKTFAEPEILELCTPIIYGSPKIAAYHRKVLDIQGNFSIINNVAEATDGRVNLLACFDEDVKVEMGVASPESGMAALKVLDRAMTDYRENAYDVLVNCPMDDGNIHIGGYRFSNTGKYIEASLGEGSKAATLFVSDKMRLMVATEGASVKDIASVLTKDLVKDKATLFFKTIRRDFNISNPRLAILALNPNQGKEEQEIIAPAIKELIETGVQAFGPYTAAEFFENDYYNEFDGILAMFYDQGVPSIKALATEGVVKFNANLPIITTEPDCHVRFDIAGQCVADERSFRHAIYMAIDIHRNRARYDEPLQHPLQKLYHEKHDDGEKVRFSVSKKKHE